MDGPYNQRVRPASSETSLSGEALIGAIDQGTSSSRFLLFSRTGELVTFHQQDLPILVPKEGWAEQDPDLLVSSVLACIDKAVKNLMSMGLTAESVVTIGITNQRETVVVWDRNTGKPLYNAILWLDGRTAETVHNLTEKTKNKKANDYQHICGLPLSTYFTAGKIRWLLDNVPPVQTAYESGNLMVGTVDTWLIWRLTKGAVYATDVTNASRTMLMNIHRLEWDKTMCKVFDIDMSILPKIRSSAEVYGTVAVEGPLLGTPISGVLGDQQAALVGQDCCRAGQVKNTYGTGCFMLCHTGEEVRFSKHGLLTTVAYQMGPDKPVSYALEGAVAVAGAAVRWLRDGLGILQSVDKIEELASQCGDTAGCYFVPAFTGLLCPHWAPEARGTIVGISQLTRPSHIARATLEAVCFQSGELLAAMLKDLGGQEMTGRVEKLRVDGGMVASNLLMQLQADLADVTIERPTMTETTSLGAAVAAAIGVGIDPQDMVQQSSEEFSPSISPEERQQRKNRWKMAVQRSLGWDLCPSNHPVMVSSPSSLVWTGVKLVLPCLLVGLGISVTFKYIRTNLIKR